MSRPAGADFCAGIQTQSGWVWQAGNRIRRQSCAGRQGRRLRRKPDAVKLALAIRN
jgi:hypothetical protein